LISRQMRKPADPLMEAIKSKLDLTWDPLTLKKTGGLRGLEIEGIADRKRQPYYNRQIMLNSIETRKHSFEDPLIADAFESRGNSLEKKKASLERSRGGLGQSYETLPALGSSPLRQDRNGSLNKIDDLFKKEQMMLEQDGHMLEEHRYLDRLKQSQIQQN